MTSQGQDFIRGIAEAYGALEREASHLENIRRLEEASKADGERIARLETKLQHRESRIADLESRIRSLEVERDDASFRQLEAEDKVAGLLAAIRTATAGMGDAVRVVDPPKSEEPKAEAMPEPLSEAQPEPMHDQSPGHAGMVGESVSPPTPAPAEVTGTGTESEALSFEVKSSEVVDLGQREPDPTVTTEAAQSPSVLFDTASQSADVASDHAKPFGKYHGQLYKDWPYSVSEATWLANGGTMESYWEGREKGCAAQ